MACTTCDSNGCAWNIIMPCKVCELNNNDNTPKPVCYCKLCSAYICKEHWDDAPARIEAAMRNAASSVAEAVKDTVQAFKEKVRSRKNRKRDDETTA